MECRGVQCWLHTYACVFSAWGSFVCRVDIRGDVGVAVSPPLFSFLVAMSEISGRIARPWCHDIYYFLVK